MVRSRRSRTSFDPVDRVVVITVGVAYPYLRDDPSEASVNNYMRSGVHGMGLAASGLGAQVILIRA
jgi:hypothetical protein